MSLNLLQKFDVLAILKAAGLNPQTSQNIGIQNIMTPIQRTTKKDPGIRCYKNVKTGKSQLNEIVLCLEKDGATLIDCPTFVSSTCAKSIVW